MNSRFDTMPNNAVVADEGVPDHIVIWLDAGIGDHKKYHHLKDAFSSTADPTHPNPVPLVDADYDEILRTVGPRIVRFEGVTTLLAVFTDVDACIRCIQENQGKRIFFITSGSLGKLAVPMILPQFKNTFTDPVTNQPYRSIYVFCHHVESNSEWMIDYVDYIHAFDFDADVLARLTYDTAEYFRTAAIRLLAAHPSDDHSAYHRLSWAHQLYQRHEQLGDFSMRRKLEEVNQLLDTIQQRLAALVWPRRLNGSLISCSLDVFALLFAFSIFCLMRRWIYVCMLFALETSIRQGMNARVILPFLSFCVIGVDLPITCWTRRQAFSKSWVIRCFSSLSVWLLCTSICWFLPACRRL